jgi:hypothetical protein
MGLFNDIPLRENGQKFYYHWFNALRTAGLFIETWLGGGAITETSFTIANGQGAASNVTGLVFSSSSYKCAHIYAQVRRKTATNEVISSGRLIAIYRDLTSTWELLDELSGDDDGVVFSITSAGQIQYTSDTVSGSSYVGTMKFKAITFAA